MYTAPVHPQFRKFTLVKISPIRIDLRDSFNNRIARMHTYGRSIWEIEYMFVTHNSYSHILWTGSDNRDIGEKRGKKNTRWQLEWKREDADIDLESAKEINDFQVINVYVYRLFRLATVVRI